jgi:ribosome maturation factor RimP
MHVISKQHITDLAESFLKGSENYLIDVKVSASNKISVLIENDQHVAIQDCINLSRHIEHSLDREQEDFELEVSSPGIDQPFRHERQYRKYSGQTVEIKLRNGIKHKGTLSLSTGDSISLLPTKSTSSKKTNTPAEPVNFSLNDILETRLVIKF